MKIKNINLSAISLERLKKVLIQDKLIGSSVVLNLLKNDLTNILQGYMDIDESGIDIKIQVTESGEYSINLSAKAGRIKTSRAKVLS